jgi:hypothetical protein
MIFKSFKKYLDVDIYEIYYSAKNQYETPNILASEKITDLPKFQTLKPYTVLIQIYASLIFAEPKI